MANYSITFSCGHAVERQLYGKLDQRQSYIDWARKSGVCPACKSADKAAACEAVEIEHALPQLSGSPKQIKWARDIRAAKVAEIEAEFARVLPRVQADKMDIYERQCALGWQLIAAVTEARVWIDRREQAGMAIIQALHKAQAK